MIETFLHACYSRIYQLPIEVLAEYAVFAAILYVALYRKYAGKRWLRPGIGGLLAGWFLAVLWTTILSREPGSYESSWIPLRSYWLLFSGGNPEIYRSCFMNAVLFYPGGLLLAELLPQRLRYRHGMLFAAICLGLFSRFHRQMGIHPIVKLCPLLTDLAIIRMVAGKKYFITLFMAFIWLIAGLPLFMLFF